ncbi:DUF4132 domain-containing protein [Actinoplanes sp. CA-142083]|uniref:DUF4132 domain-containing protein n=1 Tax=Actinoplanes sp. CA-142083 TaxID=3239903 RepID=UPI003D9168D1
MAGQGRKPVVVEGLVCAEPTVMAWEDGERDRWWSRAAALDHGREEPDWVTKATGADRLGNLSAPQVAWLVAKGPEASARALLSVPTVMRHRQRLDVGRVAVARFELDALPLVLSEAGESADRLGPLILPFRGPEVAQLVLGWWRHLGSARLWARLWLSRHPAMAARALIPAAVGRPGRVRSHASEALRHLAALGHEETILRAAEGYGEATLAALRLDDTPVPRKAKAPAWKRPEILQSGGGTMPTDEVTRLIGALSRSRLDDPPEPPPGDPAELRGVESSAAAQQPVAPADPEAEKLIAECDPASLAEFGRALLDEWLADRMPAPEAWVLLAQAHIGDDATMEKLAPLIRSWPPKSRYARAIDGYAVLATVGTDVALRNFLAIEDNMSGGPMNDRAIAYLTQAAARRGLTRTQLADRLAVTHGLDAGVTVDYGPRKFAVGVDDHLTAYLVDADGRRLARPPKPGVRDTNPEAYQQFLALKKQLRATAAAQIARVERDMLERRFRPARDLPDALLPHPILGPVARRLLWGEYAGGRLVRALRIAEDGSFADLHDTTATVGGDTPLGIVHPMDLGADLEGWAHLFADYEVLQPFPQLHRPTVELTEPQRAATGLPGFGPVTTEGVLSLMRTERWRGNGYTGFSGSTNTHLAHALPGGLALVAELDPGVSTSYNTHDRQRITEIWVDAAESEHWQLARTIPMGACDPAALSELLVELYALPVSLT